MNHSFEKLKIYSLPKGFGRGGPPLSRNGLHESHKSWSFDIKPLFLWGLVVITTPSLEAGAAAGGGVGVGAGAGAGWNSYAQRSPITAQHLEWLTEVR